MKEKGISTTVNKLIMNWTYFKHEEKQTINQRHSLGILVAVR